jgi:2,5-diketo-D-gluconate reductase B
MEMPKLGLGTWARRGPEGVAAIRSAIDIGYRHLDTAQSYDTEAEVGQAIAESGLPRGEFWVTTKIDMKNFGPGLLAPSLRASIDALGLIPDLTLIHWPWAPVAPEVYLTQLAEAQAEGLTRQIGVSNFPRKLLDFALDLLGPRILTNQFERNPLFRNDPLARHCRTRGVRVTNYLPIARGEVAQDPVIRRIALLHGATPAQVALAWGLAQGDTVIPASANPDRQRENWEAQRITLTAQDMTDLAQVAQKPRTIAPDWGPDWDPQ